MLHPDGHIPTGSHGFSQKRDLSLGVQRSAGTAAFFYLCEFPAEHRRDTIFEIGHVPVFDELSGYPMGAKIVGDLRRSSEISVGEAKRLMSFCSTSGPAFLIGAVGTGMLGSGFLGGIIAAAHYLGAAVNGMVYTAVLGKECGFAGSIRIEEEKGMQESLTEAMLSAFKSLGIILAYIVLFTFATDMMHLCGVFSLVGCTWLRAIVKGFFEMTVGCGAVAECVGISDALRCILCAGILSWGGLSVLGQSMSMLAGSGISLRYLFLSKMTHSLFSAIIAFLLAALMV